MSEGRRETNCSNSSELDNFDTEDVPDPEGAVLSMVKPSVFNDNEMQPSSMFYHSVGVERADIRDLRRGIISPDANKRPTGPKRPPPRFSTVNGVYLRCIYNIVSAVYYLRMGTVVGQCGLLYAMLMIVVCGIISSLTTMSMSVLVTNGQVKGGGIYYFVSRSLGADWGGTIGVVFSFATAFSAVLQTFGFVEVVQWLMGSYKITPGGKWDIPIIGISLATAQVISISVSLTFDFYFQAVMSVVIAVSVVSILIGCANPTTPRWKISNIKEVLYPDYLPGQSWFSIFSMFFPACCGIMAGSNISGDLKNPQKSIPIGTLGAIWTTTLLYLITAVILASAADRETLQNDMNILMSVCLWKWLGVAGVLAASVSSSSTALTDGPKIFQALCMDNILPRCFKFFAWGKKSTGDPVRGFILAYAIVVVCMFIFKDMDAVGLAMTNFFMVAYVLVSASCLVGSMSKSPSWRPTWKCYHPITAVLGAGGCIACMFLINWIWALSVCAVTLVIFCYFHWSETATSNWGEFPLSLMYTDIVQKIQKLTIKDEHVKTYRPQIEYVISTSFGSWEAQLMNLVPFKEINHEAHSIISVTVVETSGPHEECPEIDNLYVRRFGDLDLAVVGRIISETGIGRLRPNVLAVPWTNDLQDPRDVFNIVGAAFDARMGVAIAKGFESLDPSVENRWPIDIWWLVDDGGLLLLLGYLLSRHSVWSKCQLRVFTTARSDDSLDHRQMKLSSLVKLFRIPAEVKVVSGIESEPARETVSEWHDHLMRLADGEISVPETTSIRSSLFLRLRELILEYSCNSSVVLCSMPLPQKNHMPEWWLSILSFVSEAMPPFIWVHGNNENVVTFTS